jgi:formamidopyrimidine-DNA glycosylase
VQPPRSGVGRLDRHQRLYVYRRPTCLRCGSEVEWFDLANRRAYACPVEQSR